MEKGQLEDPGSPIPHPSSHGPSSLLAQHTTVQVCRLCLLVPTSGLPPQGARHEPAAPLPMAQGSLTRPSLVCGAQCTSP